jgi:hypothetical protein
VKFVELADRIWPGATGPAVHDDVLGELTHRPHGWCGRIDVGERPLDIVLGERSTELSNDILAAARHILRNLGEFEAEARRFVAQEALGTNLPQPSVLCGFGALSVHPDWRNAYRISNPTLAALLVNTQTLGRLQFTIAEERDVLEVYFDGNLPIETDYH